MIHTTGAWPTFVGACHAALRHGWQVPRDYRGRHDALIRSRVRTLSPIFAVATLAWIPMDLAWLEGSLLQFSVPLRVGIAAVLLLVARLAPRIPATLAVHAFLWQQAIGFAVLQWLVDPGRSTALEIGYGLFPFVLTAQLAMLPTPWGRTLVAATAPTVQLSVTLFISGEHGAPLWNAVWLFVLLLAVATWTSHAQLRLLVDLIGARRDAAHDALTGLPNRRGALRRLEAERQRARRTDHPLSVLMLDLDHFKRVNDRWGHAGGDRVLVEVAQVLREELRGMDLPARYGGEEFLALLPGADAAQAMDAAERVRGRIGRLRVDVRGQGVRPTVSVGVSTWLPGETVDQLAARADGALYAAKDAGRNRCVLAGRPAPPAAPSKGAPSRG